MITGIVVVIIAIVCTSCFSYVHQYPYLHYNEENKPYQLISGWSFHQLARFTADNRYKIWKDPYHPYFTDPNLVEEDDIIFVNHRGRFVFEALRLLNTTRPKSMVSYRTSLCDGLCESFLSCYFDIHFSFSSYRRRSFSSYIIVTLRLQKRTFC